MIAVVVVAPAILLFTLMPAIQDIQQGGRTGSTGTTGGMRQVRHHVATIGTGLFRMTSGKEADRGGHEILCLTCKVVVVVVVVIIIIMGVLLGLMLDGIGRPHAADGRRRGWWSWTRRGWLRWNDEGCLLSSDRRLGWPVTIPQSRIGHG